MLRSCQAQLLPTDVYLQAGPILLISCAFNSVSFESHTGKFHFLFLEKADQVKITRPLFPGCERLTPARVKLALLHSCQSPRLSPERTPWALPGPPAPGHCGGACCCPPVPGLLTTAVSMAEGAAEPTETGTFFLPRNREAPCGTHTSLSAPFLGPDDSNGSNARVSRSKKGKEGTALVPRLALPWHLQPTFMHFATTCSSRSNVSIFCKGSPGPGGEMTQASQRMLGSERPSSYSF